MFHLIIDSLVVGLLSIFTIRDFKRYFAKKKEEESSRKLVSAIFTALLAIAYTITSFTDLLR